MEQLSFPGRKHPFEGRAVDAAKFDDVAFHRRARRKRKYPCGKSWASWFSNAAVKKRILSRTLEQERRP